jgi:hypothetical protein
VSAVNVAVTNNGGMAHILTDTAAYRRHARRIIAFVDKPRVFAHAGAVLCGRGPLRDLKRWGDSLQFCAGFDEMAELLGRKFRPGLFARLRRILGGATELVLVGWSRTKGRMIVLVIANAGPNAFQLIERPGVIGPNLPDEMNAGLRWPSDIESLRDRDAWPNALLEVMRKQRALIGHRKKAELIGGAAVLTQITQGQIIQRVIHRWPDKIGAPIQ